MFTDGERLAYGHGDLHLPVGWGDIPWNALMAECTFPEGVLFNIELKQRYWYAAQETRRRHQGAGRNRPGRGAVGGGLASTLVELVRRDRFRLHLDREAGQLRRHVGGVRGSRRGRRNARADGRHIR